jgi:dipeptidyl aminopeptidase/acylaminoacyl peptidase
MKQIPNSRTYTKMNTAARVLLIVVFSCSIYTLTGLASTSTGNLYKLCFLSPIPSGWINDLFSGVKKKKVYEIINGHIIRGVEYIPKKPNPDLGIVYLHGGFEPISIKDEYKDVKYLASIGFQILVLSYEEEFMGIRGVSLLQDTKEAADAANWMKKYRFVKNVGLMGVSRGGFVAYHTFIQYQDHFSKCACLVAPTDLHILREGDAERKIPKTEINPKVLDRMWKYFVFTGDENTSSPIYYSEKLRNKPLLLIYGSQDMIVPEGQGEIMRDKINSPNCTYISLDHTHGLTREDDTQKLVGRFFSMK